MSRYDVIVIGGGHAGAEAGAAARSHMSYCGSYEIRAGEVIHRVAVSDFPNWVGGEQLRFYKFEDDKLILSAPPFQTRKGEITTFLIWERATASAGRA
ncbi:MAG: lipocalin-like domain-containing protein [Proteobacteria bacterium]|nr:lipocalin-like domain-containing protein [Pseudomonadota bacterium]